jgi:GNAT superfamily N-acetyltransferase
MAAMDDEEIRSRTDQAYADLYRTLAAHADDGEVREFGGLACVSLCVPMAMFNQVFVLRPLDDPKAQLTKAMHFFDEHKLPFVVRIRAGLDPEAERACDALGMPYSDSVPGMTLVDMTRKYRAVEGLEIRTVRDRQALQHLLRIDEEAFGIAIDVSRRMFTERLLAATEVELYVGYMDAQPIAISALIAAQRIAGVANIATLASHRGRGIGEAMTAHVIKRGRDFGCVVASLQASDMGKPVYERMGFETVCEYRTFHRPGV